MASKEPANVACRFDARRRVLFCSLVTSATVLLLVAGCEPAIKEAAGIAIEASVIGTDSNWPQLYGPHRNSVAGPAIRTPKFQGDRLDVLWSIPIGSGYGSPVVTDQYVVFNHRLGDEDIVQCVDAATGQSIWEYRVPNTFACQYEYSNGPYSTPLIHQNAVYSVGGQGQLVSLDLHSGAVNWKRELQQEFELEKSLFPVGSSPSVAGDNLIFNVGAATDHAGIVAFDLVSGVTKWQATDHGVAYASPISVTIHGQPFAFVITKIGLVSLHPETGVVDWELEHHSRSPMTYNAVSPAVYQDRVTIVAGPGPGAVSLQVLPDRSYLEVWGDRKVLDSQFNGLMVSGGCLFGFTSAGQQGAEFRCLDILTGKQQWTYASDLRRGQGLIAGDAIVLIGEHGHFTVLKRSTREPVVLFSTSTAIFDGPCYCSPAICKEGLLVKQEGRIQMIRCWE